MVWCQFLDCSCEYHGCVWIYGFMGSLAFIYRRIDSFSSPPYIVFACQRSPIEDWQPSPNLYHQVTFVYINTSVLYECFKLLLFDRSCLVFEPINVSLLPNILGGHLSCFFKYINKRVFPLIQLMFAEDQRHWRSPPTRLCQNHDASKNLFGFHDVLIIGQDGHRYRISKKNC